MSYTGTGMFERVSAGGWSYVASALLGLASESSSSGTTSWVRDNAGVPVAQRSGGSSVYFLWDGLGSTAALTDSTGAVRASYIYQPFGGVKSSSGDVSTPFRWLGAYDVKDEGWHKIGTRYYLSGLGRFGQRDPVEGGSLNAYDYAGQDPINLLDPDGAAMMAADGGGPNSAAAPRPNGGSGGGGGGGAWGPGGGGGGSVHYPPVARGVMIAVGLGVAVGGYVLAREGRHNARNCMRAARLPQHILTRIALLGAICPGIAATGAAVGGASLALGNELVRRGIRGR